MASECTAGHLARSTSGGRGPKRVRLTALTSVCASATGRTASVPDTGAGATYAWTVTNATITAGQGTSAITFAAGSAGTLGIAVVETSAAGCASGTGSTSVPFGPSGATKFRTLTPCRAFDTRNGSGSDAAAPAIEPGEVRTLDLTGRCSVPMTARSLAVNVTVTGQAVAGDLVAYRGDLTTQPITSSISFPATKTQANNGLLELARDGSMTMKVQNRATGPVHFVLDVNGYFE